MMFSIYLQLKSEYFKLCHKQTLTDYKISKKLHNKVIKTVLLIGMMAFEEVC